MTSLRLKAEATHKNPDLRLTPQAIHKKFITTKERLSLDSLF
jgi:hypothetical protein